MYLSHPVRRMREDPEEGEDVVLAVTAIEESDVVDVAAAIDRAGGTVDEQLRFGTLQVAVRQERLDQICAIEGVESVETANTRRFAGDAGENIR